MSALHLQSAGAAKGLVEALRPVFAAELGALPIASFGAVGAIRDALAQGAPCDVIVLTAAMIDAMARDGRVIPESIVALGRVRTGIAVRDRDPSPRVDERDGLRSVLLHADAIFLPDPERATAGIHFVKVLRALEIHDAVAARLQPFPNGAAAMQALAASDVAAPIGCTQVTEIRYTRGVKVVGLLPAEFELATVYCAAVMRDARDEALARKFVALLGGPESLELRLTGGFEG